MAAKKKTAAKTPTPRKRKHYEETRSYEDRQQAGSRLMTITITIDRKEKLKKIAERRGVPMSTLIGELIDGARA